MRAARPPRRLRSIGARPGKASMISAPFFRGHLGPTGNFVGRPVTAGANPRLGVHNTDAHTGRFDLSSCPDGGVVHVPALKCLNRSNAPCKI